MSVGALFSSLYYKCGLQGNQDWLWIVLPPVWESGLIFIWKTAKNHAFRVRFSLGKNGKFGLLGLLKSVGALLSSLYYECGLQGNQDWL